MMALIALSVVLALLLVLTYLKRPPPEIVEVEVPVVYQAEPEIVRSPEFRQAPYKQYKPRQFQQMGLLLGDGGDILPLYGRESRTHRDRYYYYSGSPGEQIYSLPITHQDRECTNDIGCPEFYGNEKVSVTGKSGEYNVKLYETEQLWY